MFSVFISHNYMDKPLARKISNALNNYGIETWIDESEIKIGDSLIAKIRAGIDNVDYIIALISKYSVESEWVLKELDIAMNKEIEGKKVVVLPILAGKCELPGFLKGKLYLDMSTNRNFSKNLPQLLLRFNVENVLEGKELLFTSKKLSLVDIIQILSGKKIESKIELWKNLSYSDRHIFLMNEFRTFLIEYVKNSDIANEEIIELIKAYDRCAKNENILNDFLMKLLRTDNRNLLIKAINSISTHSVKDDVVVSCIIDALECSDDKKVIVACLKYFCENYIASEESEDLLRICNKMIKTTQSNMIFGLLIRVMFSQFGDDEGIKIIVKLWQESEEDRKKQIIKSFTEAATEFQLGVFYIRSPRIREDFKNMIMASICEDDVLNADILCSLFVTDELNYIFPREEVWAIVDKVDNYSVLALLEKLNFEYNISNIFNSSDDVIAFNKLFKRNDAKIDEMIYDALADINLKVAIDILVEREYVPKYYNSKTIIMTLLKETDINKYKKMYLDCRQVLIKNCDEIENILVVLCDYIFDKSTERQLSDSLQVDLGKIDMEIRSRKNLLKFIVDIFEKKEEDFSKSNFKKIKTFIKKAKPYYESF